MYCAVDIGGTKTLIAAFDAHGKLLEKMKFPTPKEYGEFLTALEAALVKLPHKDFRQAVVAAPGRIDRKRGMVLSFGNLPWKDRPLRDDIEPLIGCPVRLENDAKIAAVSEAAMLKGEFRKVLYITFSTGIGSGFVVDGRLDPESLDAEVGHMLIEHDGKLLRWQEIASGKAIFNKYGKLARDIDDPQIWYVIAHNIALGLINVIASFTPDVIVLGGGVSTHLDKFYDRLIEDLKIYESSMLAIPVIRKAQRPEEAVIYGCYELMRQKSAKNT